MNFLAPLFLIGAVAVALPVIFHLIRRTTRERKVFSSLMFLLPTPPRLTRRSRLEHLLLLALRCLALCLLAMGFARPFIQKTMTDESPSSGTRRVVVLVDASASMKRPNLWSDARDRAESILRKASPADQVALFTFDRELHPLVSFEQWQSAAAGERVALATRRLADVSPGWSSTQLGNALIAAAETLADTEDKSAGRPRIVVITDFQEGSHPDPLQGYEWPRDIELSLETLQARHANNAGIQLLADVDETERQSGAVARVRVNNAADSKSEQFKVGWARPTENNFAGASVDVYVPPGQSRIVSVPSPAAGVNADRIILRGDDEDFDNTVFTVPPETARLSVLYLGNEPAQDPKQPLYFLERAFQETRRQAVQVLARPASSPLSATEAQAAALLIVTDSLTDERAAALHDQVTAGKTLLFVLRNGAAAPTLARLSGINSLAIDEARTDTYAMLAEIDFRHPLFAPFADPRFSDFTKIHFWKHRRVDPTAIPRARVVAKFDNGDPALLEAPVGKGRVLVLTSGWQPEDSQLALSTKFVPMLYSALDYSGAAAPPPVQYSVGDVVPLASLQGTDRMPSAIRTPDGSEVKLAAGETNFSRTTLPGIYTLPAAQGQKPLGFAVNLDAAESRTAPLAADELERLGAPVAQAEAAAVHAPEKKIQLQNSELENRQKLWRWILLAALAVLLFETWLAGRTSRRAGGPIGEIAATQA